jgi:hypothetical protein
MDNNTGDEPLLENSIITELNKSISTFQKESEEIESDFLRVESKESLLGEM